MLDDHIYMMVAFYLKQTWAPMGTHTIIWLRLKGAKCLIQKKRRMQNHQPYIKKGQNLTKFYPTKELIHIHHLENTRSPISETKTFIFVQRGEKENHCIVHVLNVIGPVLRPDHV